MAPSSTLNLHPLSAPPFVPCHRRKDDLGGAVTQSDFVAALKKVGRSVGDADLDKYEQWFNDFGSA